MAAPSIRRALSTRRLLLGCLFALLLPSPPGISAQEADLVYISNVTGTNAGGQAFTSVEDQTAAALDQLGVNLTDSASAINAAKYALYSSQVSESLL